MTGVAAVDRGIAMVFQSYALYPHMTVKENMGFGLRMNGVDKDEIHRKVMQAATTLQLDQLLDRKPKNLCGGQRQRVAIGRTIVRDPDVFLFDEPLSNLDAELRVEMRLQIARLHRQLGAAMIVVLRLGKVEQVGTPLELYHHPDNLFVAGLIGSPKKNFLNVKLLEGGTSQSTIELPGGGQTTLPIDAAHGVSGSGATLGIRPADLGAAQSDFALSMDVDVAERLGGSTFIHGRCGGLENFTVQRPGLDTTQSGDTVDIQIPAACCYLFDEDGQSYARGNFYLT